MISLLKEFLTYSKKEKAGILVLACFVLCLFSFRLAAPYLGDEDSVEAYSSEVEDFLKDKRIENEIVRSEKVQSKVVEQFKFDPNQITAQDWMRLGFSESQTKSILKYRSAGGVFKIKSDLKKLYVVDDERYHQLEDDILLPKEIRIESEVDLKTEKASSPIPFTVDINLGDTSSFIQIPGIGSFYGNAIVEYRSKLGGFVSVNQLLELWKVDQEKLDLWSPYLSSSTNFKIEQLNINTCSSERLALHPYITWPIANSIVQIRKQHGRYSSIAEIKKSALIDDDLFEKLKPYISIESEDSGKNQISN